MNHMIYFDLKKIKGFILLSSLISESGNIPRIEKERVIFLNINLLSSKFMIFIYNMDLIHFQLN